MERRQRRSFTSEYKAEAVRRVREGGKSLPQVAKEQGLTESALRNWVREADGVRTSKLRHGSRERMPCWLVGGTAVPGTGLKSAVRCITIAV
jgi:transposase-like protein